MTSPSTASRPPLVTRRRTVPPTMGVAAAARKPVANAQPTATAILRRALTDAAITTDRAGRVSGLNPAAEQASGWAHADALGESLAQCLRRDPRRARRIDDDGGDSEPRVYHLICRSGALRTIEVCESVLADERGWFGGAGLRVRARRCGPGVVQTSPIGGEASDGSVQRAWCMNEAQRARVAACVGMTAARTNHDVSALQRQDQA